MTFEFSHDAPVFRRKLVAHQQSKQELPAAHPDI